MNRREFLKALLSIGIASGISLLGLRRYYQFGSPSTEVGTFEETEIDWEHAKEAMFYKSLDGGRTKCELCPRGCIHEPGERGICRVRKNVNGKLYTLVYGNPCAVHIDPIEKKPLFHFLPGSKTLSLATAGCSLRCIHCQNWQISQASPEETRNYDLPPNRVVQIAKSRGVPVIAYTYTEPTVFYEYMHDTTLLARELGIRNVMISCGYIREKPLRKLCSILDAIKIDLKGFTEEFYERIGGASIKPVLESIKTVKKEGNWMEIVNLIIPTLNDDEEEIRDMVQWILKEVGDWVPLHFTRFRPAHKLTNVPPTPVKTLERAREIAMEEGLKFVYVGNVHGHPGESTYCPNCGKPLILRRGYTILDLNISDGKCNFCGEEIPGIWS